MSLRAPPVDQHEPCSHAALRIGAVRYLNTLPLVEGLEKLEGLELTLAAPSELLALLLEDAVEAALAPVIDLVRSPEPLAVLPAGMIGSEDRTQTVRVYSARPFEKATTVAADADSHTSVALMRIVLRERFGVEPAIEPFTRDDLETAHESGRWPETALLIGDKVESLAPPDSVYPYTLDLGEAWRELTGRPFVYAVWMCKAERAGDERTRLAGAILDRQRRHNATRARWIAARRAPERGWSVGDAHAYLTRRLSFEFGPAEQEAMQIFLEMAGARTPATARAV